jgi:hypothetical protein
MSELKSTITLKESAKRAKHNAEQSINIFSLECPDIGSLSHFTSNTPRTVHKVALIPGTVKSSDKNLD